MFSHLRDIQTLSWSACRNTFSNHLKIFVKLYHFNNGWRINKATYLVRLAIIVLFTFRLYKPHIEDFQVRYLAYLFARWAALTSENIAYHIFFNLSCKVLLTRFNNIFKWQLVKFKWHKFLRSDSRILLLFPWNLGTHSLYYYFFLCLFWLSFSFLSSLSRSFLTLLHMKLPPICHLDRKCGSVNKAYNVRIVWSSGWV